MDFKSSKRSFTPINTAVPVRYRFLSVDIPVPEQVYQGSTQAMDRQGLLLRGRIPDPDLYAELLHDRVVIGLLIELPGTDRPIRGIGRLDWLETAGSSRLAMGLIFDEIDADDRKAIVDFVKKAEKRTPSS